MEKSKEQPLDWAEEVRIKAEELKKEATEKYSERRSKVVTTRK